MSVFVWRSGGSAVGEDSPQLLHRIRMPSFSKGEGG